MHAPRDWSCRWPAEPRSVSHRVEGDARITVLELSDHVLGVEMVGRIPNSQADFVRGALDDFIERSGRAHIFWDDEALDGFDSELRDVMVQLLKSRRSQWKEIGVLTSSAVIAMLVATVGMMFGGQLQSYRSRKKFMAAVERALGGSSKG